MDSRKDAKTQRGEEKRCCQLPVLASLRLERSGREESSRSDFRLQVCEAFRGCTPPRATGFNAFGVKGTDAGRKQRGICRPCRGWFHNWMRTHG